MENPVGSLACRPYQVRWQKRGERKGGLKREEVHYCAYMHLYHKPTHIWTSMLDWLPKGTTGTGRCERRCVAGKWGDKGRWVHVFKLAQSSWQEKSGRGRKAFKNMMPMLLHIELVVQATQSIGQLI